MKKNLLIAHIILLRTLKGIFPKWTAKQALQIFLTPKFKKTSRRNLTLIAKAQSHYTSANGFNVHYCTWGSGDKKILLAHGWEGDVTHLASFVPSLIENNFQVIALDAPAHGKSSGKRINMIEYAKTINELNQQIGPFYGYIGHSFGGAAGMRFLSQFPKGAPQKSVLIASPCDIKNLFFEYSERLGLSEKIGQLMIQLMEKKYNIKVDDLSLDRMATKVNTEGLIIHDINDEIISFKEAQKIGDSWTQSKLISTQKLGHFRLLRDKTVQKETLHFLLRCQALFSIAIQHLYQ